jgi:hypothetical protein
MKLMKVGVLSAAKISTVIYAAIGLILMPFFALGGFGNIVMGRSSQGSLMLVFAILAPVFYGGVGFIGGAIAAWVFNLAAAWLGGLELQLEPLPPPAPVLQVPPPAVPN